MPLFTVRRGLEICTASMELPGLQGSRVCQHGKVQAENMDQDDQTLGFWGHHPRFHGENDDQTMILRGNHPIFLTDNIFTQQLFKRRQLSCRLSKSTPRTSKEKQQVPHKRCMIFSSTKTRGHGSFPSCSLVLRRCKEEYEARALLGNMAWCDLPFFMPHQAFFEGF